MAPAFQVRMVAGISVAATILIAGRTDTRQKEDVTHSRETAVTQAIQRVSPAVASINVIQVREVSPFPQFHDPFFDFWFPEEYSRYPVKGIGSGVVISPEGYILTNEHVVEGADEIAVTLPGGTEYEAEVIGVDRTSDLALLKIEGKKLPSATLGDSDQILIGEWVIALGNPFGLFDINKQPTATAGIISAVNLDFGKESSGRLYQGMIQTDASINSGNSGGPLCNADGEVVGINTFIFTGDGQSRGSVGIGFAIPINRAKRIAEELKKFGRVDRSFSTGLKVQAVDKHLADYLRLPAREGVIITEVEAESPADGAGLRLGDVIVKVNGKKVASRGDILKQIEERELRAGDTLQFTLYRDGKLVNVSVKLEAGK